MDSRDDRDARRKAQEWKQQFENAIDPRAKAKGGAAQKVTLGEVAAKYLARPCALKPTSEKWTRYHVEKVFKDWTDKPITGITRDMVRGAMHSLRTVTPSPSVARTQCHPAPRTRKPSLANRTDPVAGWCPTA